MGGPQESGSRRIGGRYFLERVLGSGGMGEVWLARHTALNTHVAIKFLHRASASSQSTLKRFLQEAQVTAQLQNRHAVQVFDFGVAEDGRPFLVMEWVAGESLAKRIQREGRLTPSATVTLMWQASRALNRAHVLGIVHRDFKPENILIAPDDEGREQVKVVDFGIAKLVGDLGPMPTPAVALDVAANQRALLATFTHTESLLGTPQYMSPEQVRNASDLGPSADIWAFGIVAFECLTGRLPFDAPMAAILFDNILNGRYAAERIASAGLPPSFEEWFKVACAPDPAKRFPTASQAVEALSLALGLSWDRMSVPSDVSSSPDVSGEFRAFQRAPESGGRRVLPSAVTVAESSFDDVGSAPTLPRVTQPTRQSPPRRSKASLSIALIALLVVVSLGLGLLAKWGDLRPTPRSPSIAATTPTAPLPSATEPSATEREPQPSAQSAGDAPIRGTSASSGSTTQPAPPSTRGARAAQPNTPGVEARPQTTGDQSAPPSETGSAGNPAASESSAAPPASAAASSRSSPLVLPPLGL